MYSYLYCLILILILFSNMDPFKKEIYFNESLHFNKVDLSYPIVYINSLN